MIKVLFYSFLENSVVYVLHPHFHVWSFMQGNSLNNWAYLKKKKKQRKKKKGEGGRKGETLWMLWVLTYLSRKSLVRLSYSVKQPLCMLNCLIEIIICQWVWLIFQASLDMPMEDIAYWSFLANVLTLEWKHSVSQSHVTNCARLLW